MRLSWGDGAPSPAVPAALAAASGVGLGLAMPVPPLAGGLLALVLASLAAAAAGAVRPSRLLGSGLLVLLGVAGLVQARRLVTDPRHADAALVSALPEGNVCEVTGRLQGPWRASGSLRVADLEVESVRNGERVLPVAGPVRLVVGGRTSADEAAGAGERVRARGELRLPDVSADPRSPFRLPPRPRLALKSALQVERLGPATGLLGPVHRAHRALLLQIRRNLPGDGDEDRTARALVLALLIGETADLPPRAVTAFRDGGAAHVLAVSGLQVAFLALLLHRLLPTRLVSLGSRDAIVLAATACYAVFAGGSPPVVRAALTIGVYLGARLLGRPVAAWQAVGASALVLLLLDPGVLLDAGFLLTYSAVAGLSAFGVPLSAALRRTGLPAWAAGAAGATAGAELAVLPVQAYAFHVVPLVGLASNLVVVPLSLLFLLAALALLPALLLGPVPASAALVPLRLLSDGLLFTLDLFDRLGALRFVPAPSWGLSVLLGLLLAGAVVPLPRRLRAASLAAALALGLFVVARPSTPAAPGTHELLALDVGQGDAWLLRSGTGAVLVDGGGSHDAEYEFGRLRLLPLLSRAGAVRFEAVALTHPHPDHGRGLAGLLAVAPVGQLAIPRGAERNEVLDEVLQAAARRAVPIERYGAGESLAPSGIRLDVLHPGPGAYWRARANNGSLVLRASLGGRTALLTGDVEAAAEADLASRGAPLRADVLKVAHHGSGTSTTPGFLSRVAPRVALVGVGRRNRFGHPSPAVLSRLSEAGAKVLRTDRDGGFGLLVRQGRLLPLFSEDPPGGPR
ncbi:MAG: DNA internalization-related competence protein ComEC/Rec2 [Acidobacteria bacterium]|nr:MAG: DNA internalization-related competence protein ComEC/Rec2 [Acidobacteriota bacterium]